MEEMHQYGAYANETDIIFDQEELSDSSDENYEPTNANFRTRSKDLTAAQRQQIYEALLEKSNQGTLKKNTTTEVAEIFKVNRHAVWRVWRRAKQCRANGLPVDVSSRKPKKCGRKKIVIDPSQVEAIPLRRRCTIRSLAKELRMNRTTVHRIFKDGFLRRHSSSLKPYLKEENKKERLRWCLSMLDEHTLQTQPKFKEMKNIIHQDEKWFNGTRKDVTYYLSPNEEDPHRTVRNKNYIDKVMFFCAVTNPEYDDEGNCMFDGKLGIWPFIREVHELMCIFS
jgi:DNA-binding transcriptional regulator YhcF (GntR family)